MMSEGQLSDADLAQKIAYLREQVRKPHHPARLRMLGYELRAAEVAAELRRIDASIERAA